MIPSQSIKDKIKKFEGLCLTATRCSAGVPTIGYGHTGPEVRMGQKISREKADAIFSKDIDMFAAGVSAALRPHVVSQCQFDALVSFAFNCGLAALRKSTLLKMVKADPSDPEIRSEFAKWVHAAGRRLPGLVKRRAMEADHYFGII